MTTRRALQSVRGMLMESGFSNYDFEARCLVSYCFDMDLGSIFLHYMDPVDDCELKKLYEIAKKRTDGYPLQYILGEWEFFSRKFFVGEGVLIPRQDTEVLCETAISLCKEMDSPKVLDLCSGTGCVAITLKKECGLSTVYAVERSKEALKYLRKNITLHGGGVTLVHDDALNPEFMDKFVEFDLIVSNPPYLTKRDMQSLQAEVKYEPSMALFGDEDGLLFYREMTRIWNNKLKAGGFIAYEIGINQQDDVKKILEQNGFFNVCFIKDLCDIIRVVYAQKKQNVL
ncbi:MAG: hemK [Oscillospiraceae bacterium]|nr:hemK [Oscillospiraceae bacterium]